MQFVNHSVGNCNPFSYHKYHIKYFHTGIKLVTPPFVVIRILSYESGGREPERKSVPNRKASSLAQVYWCCRTHFYSRNMCAFQCISIEKKSYKIVR